MSRRSTSHDSEPPNKVPRTRISRACENCRARRKKCNPPYPCQACRDAGLPDCLVRDKPRPLRQPRSQNAGSAPIEGSTFPHRTRFLQAIDDEVERIYTAQTGEAISLGLKEEDTHPGCSLTFVNHMLPFCSYMLADGAMSLFERYISQHRSLAPDEQGLVFSSLALGYVRLRGFGSKRHARDIPHDERLDVPYFRHAVHAIDKLGKASFASLHALCGLWYYSTLACTPETSRDIVSWMITQAKELGIYQDGGPTPGDRADLMLMQILYADYLATSLTGRPPIIRPAEFETMSIRSRPVASGTDPVVVPRRSLAEILVLNTHFMMNLHDSRNAKLSIDGLLRIEERWDTWCATWVSKGRATGNKHTDTFLAVLWDWGRLTLRAVTVNDSRLSMASLAVLSRAAMRILTHYYDMYLNLEYNPVWQHLRHIVTCAHVVIIAQWRFEVTKGETEAALGQAVWMLKLIEPWWRKQASEAMDKIIIIASALGLSIKPPPSTERVGNMEMPPSPEAEPAVVQDGGAVGILYEVLDGPDAEGWTIDLELLLPDYSA